MLGGGLEGPVRFVLGSRIDPASQGLFLFITQRLVDLRRRHLVAGIITGDAVPDFTLPGITGNDGRKTGIRLSRSIEEIEAQSCFAGGGVRAVTGVAVIGKNRPNVLVEGWGRRCTLFFFRRSRHFTRKEERHKGHQQDQCQCHGSDRAFQDREAGHRVHGAFPGSPGDYDTLRCPDEECQFPPRFRPWSTNRILEPVQIDFMNTEE